MRPHFFNIMISVVILHHNKAPYSHACLQSLLSSSARPLEVVNVDNGSSDETATVLAEWQDQAATTGIAVQRLDFSENIGAVRGRNEAMKVARGDYIVFLDNDTIIGQADWLERLQEFLDADSARGIVAPKLLFPWQPFDIECCGTAISPTGRVQYVGRGQERGAVAQPQKIQCAISAAWMMPRRLYEELGGLDEVYSPVQYEDLDYCYKAREAGYEVWTLPAVEIFHFEHTTTAGSDDINFKYVTTKNGLTFKKRWIEHFRRENATTDEAAQWQTLPKQSIDEVNWQALVSQA